MVVDGVDRRSPLRAARPHDGRNAAAHAWVLSCSGSAPWRRKHALVHIRQMLNSPAMQSLMQNPEAISAMIQNNPQMRALM